MRQIMYGQMSSHFIITESSSNLRRIGRVSLQGRWGKAVTAVLIYFAVTELPMFLLDFIWGKPVTYGSLFQDSTYNSAYPELANRVVGYSSGVSTIYDLLLGGAFAYGLAVFMLSYFRRRSTDFGMIFEGFGFFLKTLGLYIYRAIFIFMWSLLFVIPGIIAAIRYSQAFLILADDPNKSITQCMEESKAMMTGNKAKFFWMNLSFIGWVLLAAVPACIVSVPVFNMLDMGKGNSMLLVLVAASFVLELWVMAYILMTNMGFYEILSGRMSAQGNETGNFSSGSFTRSDGGGEYRSPASDKEDYTGKRGRY